MSTDDSKIRTDAHVPPPEWSGAVFGIAIVVVAVSIGGAYIWYRMHAPDTPPPAPLRINDEPETARAVADVAILDALSPADDIPSIQADLDATVLDSIENDLTAIDAELAEFETKVNGR
jgi:hypothetical protein